MFPEPEALKPVTTQTCPLLRNLNACQEATVGTGCGTTDWFQIGKGVCKGCILSCCLFNFYAECCAVLSCSVVSDSLQPHGLQPPGSSVPGILHARILGWVAMLSSRGSSQPRDRTQVSCIGRWILYRLSHQGAHRVL